MSNDGSPQATNWRGRRRAMTLVGGDQAAEPVVDPWRAVIFPNRIREHRLAHGRLKLLSFANGLPDIPYIRLSKIERGEVTARADELVQIAAAIGVAPAELLIDVDAPEFAIAEWFAPFAEGAVADDPAEARMALLVAGAMRRLREANPRLTAPVLEAEFAIPPVTLSRIENAQKGLARWNANTVGALCRLFDVPDEAALRDSVEEQQRAGALGHYVGSIAGPVARLERTRQRIAALRVELKDVGNRGVAASPGTTTTTAGGRTVPVHGASLGEGLLSLTKTGARIEAPSIAGPRAFGVRVCRATLGGGLPGQSTVIVDPDRYPQAGGLALVRDGAGYRIVAIALDRTGAMMGYADFPPFEIAIDTLAPAEIAAVIAAIYV